MTADDQNATPGASVSPDGTPKKSKKKWIIGGSIAAVLILFAAIGAGGGNGDNGDNKSNAADDVVASQTAEPAPEPEAEAEAEAEVRPVEKPAAEPETPAMSLSQKNAVRQGESYLSLTAFSRSGLIGQLEFESYSTEDATFAADYIAPDWNAEAAEQAQSYLDLKAFSRQELVDQLLFEGYTPEQAEFGVVAVGY